MLDHNLLPDFSSDVIAQMDHLHPPFETGAKLPPNSGDVRDLRHLLWSSIDNDDSLDLDQLTVAEQMPSGVVKILVAVADVSICIHKNTAVDQHARVNTTSIYTAAMIYPMLPEMVSTNLTSLNYGEDRYAVVVEMQVGPDGSLTDGGIYRALVRNQAKLAYRSVAGWLEKGYTMPDAVAAVPGLAENLKLQDEAAHRMKTYRHIHGALSLTTIEAKPVFDGDQIQSLEVDEPNRAREIIEDFMIAANGATARYLSEKKFPSIRRVVRTPKRWDRIVEIAADHHVSLPVLPNSKALEEFLVKQRESDPLTFSDVSLSIIKLLGAGEYVAELPDGDLPGHFGLAVKDYGHSTAPNRRFPDLVTQRLLRTAMDGGSVPYTKSELDEIALHCTEAEDAANKVERQVGKSAAALLLESRIGERFDAIVTGASEKGTWVRLLQIPVEGKLISGFHGLDVGHRVQVELTSVDIDKGFIDFSTTHPLDDRQSHE